MHRYDILGMILRLAVSMQQLAISGAHENPTRPTPALIRAHVRVYASVDAKSTTTTSKDLINGTVNRYGGVKSKSWCL